MTTMRFASLCLALALAAPAGAADSRLAPIPKDQAVSSHGPYEMGACETCHARNDAKNPGPAAVTNDTCYGCHDEFKGKAAVKMERAIHPATASATCTGCHSPHNARKKKLLLR